MFVYILRLKLNLIISLLSKVRRKLKAKFLVLLSGYDFKMVGKNFKLNVKPYSAKITPLPNGVVCGLVITAGLKLYTIMVMKNLNLICT